MMASLEYKERADAPSSTPSILLLEALAQWVEKQPTKKVVTWLDDGGRESTCYTYEQIDQETRSLASYLLASGVVKANEPVLLVYPPSLDFLVAFLACLRIGAIAVPVYPPEAGKAQKDISMFVAVQSSCGATVALSTTRYCQAKQLDDLRSYFSLTQSVLGLGKNGGTPWPDVEWLPTDTPQARGHRAHDQDPPNPTQPNDIAFLQYTSGSTSEPKGVMISHANLAANLSAIIASLQAGRDTVVASWLPQYHDMGLIGAYLGAIYCGGSGYYMSPLTFVRRPSLWIEIMSRYQATHIQAPSFAYGLSARKFRSAQHPFHSKEEPSAGKEGLLDLSSVRHMINGAEPVDLRGMQDFYDTFGKFGLRSGVIYPTYGLAENTVFVTSNGRRTLNVDRTALETDGKAVDCVSGGVTIVGCGDVADSARLGIEVTIVDPDTHEQLPDGAVGEIWLRGLSRAAGYYGREEQSVQTFGAKLKGQLKDADNEPLTYQHKGRSHVSPCGFLRTGDQGLILHDEVFITGRLKDLIIVRGRNVYPHDLERCVEHTLANEVRGGCTAAFATTQTQGHDNAEGETLTFAAEVRDEGLSPSCAEALGLSIRRVLAQTHNAQLSTLYLLRPRTIPKTTSGKIARAWVRKAAEAGKLDTILTWHAPADYEETSSEGLESLVEGQSGEGRRATEDGKEAPRTGDKDVDGLSLDEVVERLQAEVARITKEDTSSILVDAPLARLGLDSLQGMQLHSLLEERFAVAVPEFVMFDKETTLTVLGRVVKLHGVLPTPTTLVDMGRLANLELQAEEARAKAIVSKGSRVGRKTTLADLLPLSTVRSSLLTGRFPPHHLRSSAESANDMTTRIALWRLRLLALSPTSPLVFGFFAALAAVCTLATSSSVQMVVAVLVCLLSVRLMQGPFAPGSSGLSQQHISLMWRLFSFKVAYEGEALPAERPVLVVLVNAVPHPIPTAQMLLSSAFPVVFGRPLTLLLDQPSAFSGSLFYQVLTLFGARPVSDLTSVVAAKGCALMSQDVLSALDDASLSDVLVVPAVVLATPSTLDKRTPVTVVLGSSITLPTDVKKPSTTIRAAVMDAAGRLFDKHKEAWGLHDDASLSQ